VLGVEIVLDPKPPFVLEAFATSLCRRVNPPILREGELSDELVFNEELDDMLAHAPGCEGPHGRSFPFDLEGGMIDGLLGHSG